jgi:hypothetical protein
MIFYIFLETWQYAIKTFNSFCLFGFKHLKTYKKIQTHTPVFSTNLTHTPIQLQIYTQHCN